MGSIRLPMHQSNVLHLIDHFICCGLVQYAKQSLRQFVGRAASANDDAVMSFASGKVFQSAHFKISAVMREDCPLVAHRILQLLIVILVEIACFNRGDNIETTRAQQIRHQHVYVFVEVEVDEQFRQGLSPAG